MLNGTRGPLALGKGWDEVRIWMDGEGDGQRDGEGKATLQIVV